MKVEDVKRTLDMAIIKARIVTKQRPRLLSDNGSCYIATELKDYLKKNYNISSYISGIDVLYPDGTETQRKGVKIDMIVQPTIAGIKAGRDELLEKAKELITGSK